MIALVHSERSNQIPKRNIASRNNPSAFVQGFDVISSGKESHLHCFLSLPRIQNSNLDAKGKSNDGLPHLARRHPWAQYRSSLL